MIKILAECSSLLETKAGCTRLLRFPSLNVIPTMSTISRLAYCVLPAVFLLVGGSHVIGSSIEVSPLAGELRGRLARIQFAVKHVETGRDITRDSVYESLNPDVIAVDARGMVRPIANGDGMLRITSGEEHIHVPVAVCGFDDLTPTSFRNDVTPILNRAGCTGGSCHAAQYGQGGFKLSLWGFSAR